MENPDILDIIVDWANTQHGLRGKLYLNDARIAQVYTGPGYNNYKRVGVWLGSCIVDPEGLRIWGPNKFGEKGGTPRNPDGDPADRNGTYWLKPTDREFFDKLHKLMFRFHRRKP